MDDSRRDARLLAADAGRHDRRRRAVADVCAEGAAIRRNHARPPAAGGSSPRRRRTPTVAELEDPRTAPKRSAGTPPPPAGSGFQRAGVTASAGAPPAANEARPPAEEPGADVAQGAAEGFLVNGSVNNGAASPFAQLAAFGNNRRGVRSLYNFGVGHDPGQLRVGFAAVLVLQPAHGEARLQRRSDRGHIRRPAENSENPSERSESHRQLPADLGPHGQHRAGADADGARTRRRFLADARRVRASGPTGRPVNRHGRSPATSFRAIASARRPRRCFATTRSRTSTAAGGYNFQTPIVTAVRQDSIQTRITQPGFGRNNLSGTFGYQRTTTDTTSVFAFADSTATEGLDASVNFSRRFSQFVSLRLRYQFTRLATRGDALFRESHERVGRRGHRGQQPGSGELGSADA